MSTNIPSELKILICRIKGLRCWHISCGGAAGPTFKVALGGKVQRSIPLRNPAQPEEYRQFEAEASLLVWGAWRLDGPDAPLSSSDDTEEGFKNELGRLIGATVVSVEVVAPAWDLTIGFSNAMHVRVFCDYVPPNQSPVPNWYLTFQDVSLYVDSGGKYTIKEKGSS